MSLQSVCLFRLSALGDVTHVLPVIHALRARWPGLAITWVIGTLEARLVAGIPDVELIAIDRKKVLAARRSLRDQLRGRSFDALLLMQVSLRANLISTAVRAQRRIGYPRSRSKELHGWFVNEHLAEGDRPHVLDQLLAFAQHLGAPSGPPVWDLPIPDDAQAFAVQHLPGQQPTLVISPCSSHTARNWSTDGYVRMARHALARGFRVALVGGRSALERQTADAIQAGCDGGLVDLVGKDTLKQLLAILKRADIVISPDSGPAHFANAVGTPTIALHAATDPRRSGPYSNLTHTVDAYDRAARRFRGRPAQQLPWGTKIEVPGVMDLITVEEVIAKFDELACRLLG